MHFSYRAFPALLLAISCSSWGQFWQDKPAGQATNYVSGDAQWARLAQSSGGNSRFNKICTDSPGNIITVGYADGTSSYSLGNGVTISGFHSGRNVLIVKYDSAGNALWARSTVSGANDSVFNAVATDSAGNIYAVGNLTNNITYGFGNGVTIQGAYASSVNGFVIKYDSAGNAQWAKSTTTAPSVSRFNGVAVDSAGGVYVVGDQGTQAAYTYGGTATTATGGWTNLNAVMVKFDSSGNALWAIKAIGASGDSTYSAIATDNAGGIFAGGYQNTASVVTYGGLAVSGAHAGSNATLVKFDASGNGVWGRTTTTAAGESLTNAVITDTAGNIFVSGSADSTGLFTINGQASFTTVNPAYTHAFVVKFSAAGNAQWASTPTVAPDDSFFTGLAAPGDGGVVVVGSFLTSGTFHFGSGQSATGLNAGANAVAVRYDSSGNANWVRAPKNGTSSSAYSGAITGNDGFVYFSGYQNGTTAFSYGNGVTVTASSGNDSALSVKFYP